MASSHDEQRKIRVRRLIESARLIADANTSFGKLARQSLITSTGLSAPGVDAALEYCLETKPSEAELDQLLDQAPIATHAHVLLSANVFVAAHRAIALALATSERVTVRASRREPVMAELLHAHAPNLFTLTDTLRPLAGEHVFAYGSDETLTRVRSGLPSGVTFHAHGSGIGVTLVNLDTIPDEAEIAAQIAWDTALFDQRGCLSPRAVLTLGNATAARDFAEKLAAALAEIELQIPRGELDAAELADISRFRDSAAFAADIIAAGKGWLSFSRDVLVPPIGRNLHVAHVERFDTALTALGLMLASIGSALDTQAEQALRTQFRKQRWSRVGKMQMPPLDGPVDLRTPSEGEVIV